MEFLLATQINPVSASGEVCPLPSPSLPSLPVSLSPLLKWRLKRPKLRVMRRKL